MCGHMHTNGMGNARLFSCAGRGSRMSLLHFSQTKALPDFRIFVGVSCSAAFWEIGQIMMENDAKSNEIGKCVHES